MKVHDSNLNGATATQTGGAQEVHGAGRSGNTRAHGANGEGDRVELSNSLGTLSRAIAAHHTDRKTRVQELAAQYRRGEYQPDAAATARAMVSEAMAPAG